MKGTVNPFEPWRPLADRIPPSLHVGRPWRPPPPPPVRAAVEKPPFVEPVNPAPRSKPPERPKQPQGQAGQPSAQSKTDPQLLEDRVLASIILFLLLPLCLVGLICLGETHYFRVIVAFLGIGISIWAAWRRAWHTRLKWMVAGLALAGLSAWFVPTARGVSLWSAYRQIEELRLLPVGDIAAFQRGAAARRTLMQDFPSFTVDLKQAEKAWLRRTVDEAIENADRQLDKDPDAVLVGLHRLNKEVSQLEYYGLVRKDLESARRRAVQACLKVVQP